MEPITTRRCTVAELESAPNFDALLAEYAQESAIDGLPPPSAQMGIYCQMEAVGVLHFLGAFSGDTLAGFAAIVVSVLPHYGVKTATTESLFMGHAFRKGSGAGLKLLTAAEALAKDLGAVGLFVSAPIGGRLEQVLPRIGFQETNRVFFRGLA